MNRPVYETDEMDLSLGGSTKFIELNGTGPISIQPVFTGVSGTPTYTVEVSNDGSSYVEYHKSAKNVSIDDKIWIAYDLIPWQYMRLTVTSGGGDAGLGRFKLYINGYDG